MYKHVLAGTDFSELGDRAVERGIEVADRFGARLTVLHIMPEPEVPRLYNRREIDEHLARVESAKEQAKVDLAERVAKLSKGLQLEVELEVRTGEPAEQMLEAAEKCGADTIVVGTSGKRGMKRWLLGSNAELVVRGAECDVIVVGRPHES